MGTDIFIYQDSLGAVGSHLLNCLSIPSPCCGLAQPLPFTRGPQWISRPLQALHVAVVFSFAGAAGCVATLLHDAAMNPAEGNDSLTFPSVGSCICISEPFLYFWFAEESWEAPEFWWENSAVLPYLTTRGHSIHVIQIKEEPLGPVAYSLRLDSSLGLPWKKMWLYLACPWAFLEVPFVVELISGILADCFTFFQRDEDGFWHLKILPC